MKPDHFDPDVWTIYGVRDSWRDRGEWAWWLEAFDGLLGYLIIGILFLAIIVAWPR